MRSLPVRHDYLQHAQQTWSGLTYMHAQDSDLLRHLEGPALPIGVQMDPPLLKVLLQGSAHNDCLLSVAMLFGLQDAYRQCSFPNCYSVRCDLL